MQVIPKVRGRLTQLSKMHEEDKPLLGHLMYVAAQVGGWVGGCVCGGGWGWVGVLFQRKSS